MDAQNTNITQLDKANATLVALAAQVTTADRKAAMQELQIGSRQTVFIYLKGKGKDLDTAVGLIRVFRRRIEERERELAAA
ncbi:hypothetical protein [Flaviaesturariibacter amylovorans]|uniref:Uncharacterized protein n=1 Tax=Flaviaesturariibacter amylovorans TaxID=1084520 RepID=A0ABP8GQ16_9BACT